MTLHISREQARRFLALYHFTPTDLMGTIERLATVQYDPLNPVGRNPDLVFQARVPGYQVNDWQKVAYTDRLIYDAWDKQPLAITMNEGVCLAVEVDQQHIQRRLETGYCDEMASRSPSAWWAMPPRFIPNWSGAASLLIW